MFVSTNKVFKLGPESLCFSPKLGPKLWPLALPLNPALKKPGKCLNWISCNPGLASVANANQNGTHFLHTSLFRSILTSALSLPIDDISTGPGWQPIEGPTCQISEYDNVYHGQTYPRLLWHFSLKLGSRAEVEYANRCLVAKAWEGSVRGSYQHSGRKTLFSTEQCSVFNKHAPEMPNPGGKSSCLNRRGDVLMSQSDKRKEWWRQWCWYWWQWKSNWKWLHAQRHYRAIARFQHSASGGSGCKAFKTQTSCLQV